MVFEKVSFPYTDADFCREAGPPKVIRVVHLRVVYECPSRWNFFSGKNTKDLSLIFW